MEAGVVVELHEDLSLENTYVGYINGTYIAPFGALGLWLKGSFGTNLGLMQFCLKFEVLYINYP